MRYLMAKVVPTVAKGLRPRLDAGKLFCWRAIYVYSKTPKWNLDQDGCLFFLQKSTAMIVFESLPASFEAHVYRERNPEVTALTDEELRSHYAEIGEKKGFPANRLINRNSFVALIPQEALSLEIGPFCNPLLRGPHAHYFDVMPRAGLEERARKINYPRQTAPDINYVSAVGDLSIVKREFDCVLSSHCIEHQPDLINHLKQVSRVLRPGGRYFLLIPDKRFCFDAFNHESTIADILDAHHASRRVHQLKSIIEHRALTTHNDPVRHWQGDHGSLGENNGRILSAIKQHEASNGNYVDVHAWYFTPSNALTIFSQLYNMKYVDLDVIVIYPTRRNSNEFWMVLAKD